MTHTQAHVISAAALGSVHAVIVCSQTATWMRRISITSVNADGDQVVGMNKSRYSSLGRSTHKQKTAMCALIHTQRLFADAKMTVRQSVMLTAILLMLQNSELFILIPYSKCAKTFTFLASEYLPIPLTHFKLFAN